MRPYYRVKDTVDGDTLLRRSHTGQIELWQTSGDRYGVYLWVARPDRQDDKLCSFRVHHEDAQELFDSVTNQLSI